MAGGLKPQTTAENLPFGRRISRRQWMRDCVRLFALTAVGCRRGNDRAYSRGSTVTVAYCCGKEALNPSHDMNAKFLVFLPLAAYNRKGELEGRLARSWEHSPDYREWTYHLRTDVRWHDGVPVTAHDIKFTIDLTRPLPDLDYGAGAFESVTVVDNWTVRIRSGHARNFMTSMVYYPKHLLEGFDPKKCYEWEFWTHPVGNGPYRFVRLLPETMMEFEANPEYYRGKPGIERVILKFSGDARLTELLSGKVDTITDVSPVQILKLTKDPRFRVYHDVADSSAWAIYWRNDHPLFRDPNIRRALTLAINRRELLQVLNLPENIPIFDGVFTPRQFRRGNLPEPLPYDPALSQALLEAAGWRDRNGDGVRERDGKNFRFTAMVSTFSTENVPGYEEAAVYVQSQLRRVGVRMDIRTFDPSVVHGKLKTGDFEAAFYPSRFYEAAWLERFPFSEDSPAMYKNAKVLRLIDQAKATADPDVEDRVYRELMEVFRADLPVTFLCPYVVTTVAHRRIRGLSSPYRTDPVSCMEDLWLKD